MTATQHLDGSTACTLVMWHKLPALSPSLPRRRRSRRAWGEASARGSRPSTGAAPGHIAPCFPLRTLCIFHLCFCGRAPPGYRQQPPGARTSRATHTHPHPHPASAGRAWHGQPRARLTCHCSRVPCHPLLLQGMLGCGPGAPWRTLLAALAWLTLPLVARLGARASCTQAPPQVARSPQAFRPCSILFSARLIR